MKRLLRNRVFRFGVITSGNLQSQFAFETEDELNEWIAKNFVLLKERYGYLKYENVEIGGLIVGDLCHVRGDKKTVHRIEDIYRWNTASYSFVFKNGRMEGVANCYALSSSEYNRMNSEQYFDDIPFVRSGREMRQVWDTISTPIYRIVDSNGVNVLGQRCRRLTWREWVFMDKDEHCIISKLKGHENLILESLYKPVAYNGRGEVVDV